MAVRIPLSSMSVEEKIQAMESLWSDLCARAGSPDSPDWHGEVLTARQAAVEAGSDHFEDWAAAKAKIKQQTS